MKRMKKALVFTAVMAIIALGSSTVGAQTYFTLLHSFEGFPDGSIPEGSLISNGSTLYGMTWYGGACVDEGTVFSIQTDGTDYTILHSFCSGDNDGENPHGSLTLGGTTLYGMTCCGGGGPSNNGVIFSIRTDGTDFTLLHRFAGGDDDGRYPEGSLILDGSTLYGMTEWGGGAGVPDGVVFSIQTNGTGFTLLHRFGAGDDGGSPTGSLILDGSTLYGMTFSGGAYTFGGTVFSIQTNGTGYTLLHSFAGGDDDGKGPKGDLVLGGSTLYGMTYYGGASDKGTIFSLQTNGTGFTLLHTFSGDNYDGGWPYGSLILDGSTLYGMNSWIAANDDEGKIFSIQTDGTGFTVLHSFAGYPDDGDDPHGSLIFDGSTFYGMTQWGGASDDGVIFSLGPEPPSSPTPTETPAVTNTPTKTPTGPTPTPGAEKLAILVSQNVNDLNIYFWNTLTTGDWSYWDCYSRNPSPLARDLWQIPTGNDGVGLAALDFAGLTRDELAVLVRQNVGDLNIYFWNAPVPGDWTYWDAVSRNPSPAARDLWQIPIGNDAVDVAAVNMDDAGTEELAMLVSQGLGDLNIYFWNAPVRGDWRYWDCYSRNPSPLARDLWQIPIGNTAVGMTSLDFAGLSRDELAVLVSQGAGDLNIYFWNAPVPGDWTYWDCYYRNPSPLARDLWQIPIGNDAVGITAVDHDGDGERELAVLVSQGAGDLNIYFWNAPVAGDWTYWDCFARNPSPLARDLWQIPIGNNGVGLTDVIMQ